MKTLKTISASLILIIAFSSSIFAQSNAKVLAVINEAEWCPTCQHNGDRAMKVFKANNKGGKFQFVMNNLTNDDTKMKSAEDLKNLGLTDAIAPYKGTGTVYFFNADTKALISNISIAKTNEELAATMLSALKVTGCKVKEHSCD